MSGWRRLAIAAVLSTSVLAGCQANSEQPVKYDHDLVVPADARAAAQRHQAVVSQAVSGTDETTAQRLLASVETGPAAAGDRLALAELFQVRSTARRYPGASPSTAPAPAAGTAAAPQVFVGHEHSYPASFLAVSPSPLDQAAAGQPSYRLEVYVQDSAGAPWKNVLYSALDDRSGGFHGVEVDAAGFASHGPQQNALAARAASVPGAYVSYLTAALSGRSPPPAPAFKIGAQTDQLLKAAKEDHASLASDGVTLSPETSPYRGGFGPYLYAGPAGTAFVLFAVEVDSIYSGSGGAYCLPQPPTRHVYGPAVAPGLYTRIVDHRLWTAGVVVPAPADAPLQTVAGSARRVGSDSTPCY
jgi:hypothetical protein